MTNLDYIAGLGLIIKFGDLGYLGMIFLIDMLQTSGVLIMGFVIFRS